MRRQYTDAPRVLSSGCAPDKREGKGMPKTKNLGKLKDRFEVRGGIINEFDFHQGQREFAEEERNRLAQQQGESPLPGGGGEGQPESEAERVARLMEEARQKAEKNLRRSGKAPSKAAGAGQKSAAGKSAKGGAKKAAKKSAGKKSVAKKSSVPRQGGAKKSGGKKGAARKGGAKKGGAKKSG